MPQTRPGSYSTPRTIDSSAIRQALAQHVSSKGNRAKIQESNIDQFLQDAAKVAIAFDAAWLADQLASGADSLDYIAQEGMAAAIKEFALKLNACRAASLRLLPALKKSDPQSDTLFVAIQNFEYSAHLVRNELRKFARQQDPKRAAVTRGRPPSTTVGAAITDLAIAFKKMVGELPKRTVKHYGPESEIYDYTFIKIVKYVLPRAPRGTDAALDARIQRTLKKLAMGKIPNRN